MIWIAFWKLEIIPFNRWIVWFCIWSDTRQQGSPETKMLLSWLFHSSLLNSSFVNALDLESECTYNCVSLFLDMFDSMPAQSPTTESKAATTPSVDLFGAGTRVEIHYSVWNLFISSGFYASTPLSPLPSHLSVCLSLWFENCACDPLVKSWILLSHAGPFVPAVLILSFAPPPPCFSSFLYLALCLHR